jgi:hypothetical protein
MRMMGHNVLAILLAAIVIYAIEFVIFAVLMTPDQYTALSGYPVSGEDMSRMPFGAIPPILAAIGLSLVIKWRNAPGLMGGLSTGVMMAVFFGLAVSLYSFIYGPNSPAFIGIDAGHFIVCYGIAGAILGAWK